MSFLGQRFSFWSEDFIIHGTENSKNRVFASIPLASKAFRANMEGLRNMPHLKCICVTAEELQALGVQIFCNGQKASLSFALEGDH